MKLLYAMPALLTLLLSLLTGCWGKQITDADLVGTWHGRDQLGNSTEKFPVLQFAADHTFRVSSLPRRYIWHDGDPEQITGGQGMWHLVEKKGQQFRHVKLDFKSVDALGTGLHTEILVDASGDETKLFFWEGEEGGKRFVFIRDLNHP